MPEQVGVKAPEYFLQLRKIKDLACQYMKEKKIKGIRPRKAKPRNEHFCNINLSFYLFNILYKLYYVTVFLCYLSICTNCIQHFSFHV